MKVDKIQIDMIKAYFKDQEGFKEEYHYFTDEDNAYIVFKGVVIYVIPINKVLLDIEFMFRDKDPLTNLKRCFDSVDNAKEITYAYDKPVGNGICSFYRTDEGEEIALDKRLLKPFEDKKFTPTYKGTKHNAPVFVFDYDVLLGLVLPVVIK